MHLDLLTTAQSTAGLGPLRSFSLVATADCIVQIEALASAVATSGPPLRDDKGQPLILKGPASRVLAHDPSTYLRYRIISTTGTVTSCFVDADPGAAQGPQGPAGPNYTLTGVKTADYTANAGELVLLDPSGGAFSVTLPAAASVSAGKSIALKNTTTSTTAVTVARSGSDTIEGGTSATLNTSKGSAVYVSDGVSAWWSV